MSFLLCCNSPLILIDPIFNSREVYLIVGIVVDCLLVDSKYKVGIWNKLKEVLVNKFQKV